LKEISLHLLDIVENSLSAKADEICITITENSRTDTLNIKIQDNGIGMDAETVAKIIDPFVTSRTTRKVGLGIPLLKAAAEACNGYLKIWSEKGKGTDVEVQFQLSHIDRMPLGDIPGTLLSLVTGTPNVHWVCRYSVDDKEFVFDDQPIKAELEGVPLSEPEVIRFLKNYLKEGFSQIQN